ncbi:MAG TPA: hypothetical protein VGH37_21555, partial [Candidatus Acidoferrum sp.]
HELEREGAFPNTCAPVCISRWTCVMNRRAVLYALISAGLFGVSTPAAKFLVGSIHPVTLAGLLYCGAGVGLAVLRRVMPSIVTGAPEVYLCLVAIYLGSPEPSAQEASSARYS